MPSVLFIWNTSGMDANIGSYNPSVYAAKSIGYKIDIAMNFDNTPDDVIQKVENELGVRLINICIDRNPLSLINVQAYKSLVNLLCSGEYDIVHCNTPMGSILGRLAAKKVGIRRVLYMNRGFHFYKGAPLRNWIVYYNIEKFFARHYTDAIATINPTDFTYAKKFRLRGNSSLKYSLPGPGVNLTKFVYNNDERILIRKELGLGVNDIAIVSVGELIDRKNIDVILRAMKKVNEKRLYYIIVGEGIREGYLKSLSDELHIADHVKFVGFQFNVERYYSSADIFALTSFNEGFGRVGIEAMHVGLPVVTSNAQGINQYSINGVTGFKHDPTDVEGFASSLRLLLNDDELRRKMAQGNRRFAEKFSMENTGALIAAIYKELMNRKEVSDK